MAEERMYSPASLIKEIEKEARLMVLAAEARAGKAAEQRDRLLSAYKVWKDATLKRCKLLSSRESSDSMLFPDQAFIETADRIAREVRDDGGRS